MDKVHKLKRPLSWYLSNIISWPLLAKLENETVYLRTSLAAANSRIGELKSEIAFLKAQNERLAQEKEIIRRGQSTLLAFIHKSQRLTVPFSSGAIRAELQKAQK